MSLPVVGLLGQEECGFEMSPEVESELLKQIYAELAFPTSERPQGFSVVPVRFCVRRLDDGSPAPSFTEQITQDDADEALAWMNSVFAPINISFVQCGPISYINSEQAGSGYVPRTNFSYVSTALNVTLGSSTAGSPLGSASGLVYNVVGPFSFPFNHTNALFLKGKKQLLGPTFPHEFGHSLALVHTFNGAGMYDNFHNPNVNTDFVHQDANTRERVIREYTPGLNYSEPNNVWRGDRISDTPAWGALGNNTTHNWPDPDDPDCFVTPISAPWLCNPGVTYDNLTCEYTGNYVDYNGMPLEDTDVSIRNFMSYTGDCREAFTVGQFDRMANHNEQHGIPFWDGSLCSNHEDYVEFWGTAVPIPNVTISVVHPGSDGKHSISTSGPDGFFHGILYADNLKSKLAWIGSGDRNQGYDRYSDYSYDIFHYTHADWSQGVTTADIIRLGQHILGIDLLDGYGQLAADINNDGRLTTLDQIGIRKLILGITQSFPQIISGPWRFIPEYVPSNYNTAFHSDPFNMMLNGTYYTQQAPYVWAEWEYELQSGLDGIAGFDGVKMGDVNGDAMDKEGVGGEDCPTRLTVIDSSQPFAVREGDSFILRLNARNVQDAVGFQLDFTVDEDRLALLEIGSLLDGFSMENVSRSSGEVRVLWVSPQLTTMASTGTEALFDFWLIANQDQFDALQRINLSEMSMRSRFYDSNGCEIPVQLEWQAIRSSEMSRHSLNHAATISTMKVKEEEPTAIEPEEMRCFPNPPLNGTLTIELQSNENSFAWIVVAQVDGKILLKERVHIAKGRNGWGLNTSNWPYGVLLVSVQTDNAMHVERIVNLE